MYNAFIVTDITGGMGVATSRKLQELGYKNLYTIHNSFEEIIEILKMELKPIIDIFRQIGIMNSEKETLLHELLTNHRNYTLTSKPDINWWSTQFYKIHVVVAQQH